MLKTRILQGALIITIACIITPLLSYQSNTFSLRQHMIEQTNKAPMLTLSQRRIRTNAKVSLYVSPPTAQPAFPLRLGLYADGASTPALHTWDITDRASLTFQAPEMAGQYALRITSGNRLLEMLQFQVIAPQKYPAITLNQTAFTPNDIIRANVQTPVTLRYGDLWLALYTSDAQQRPEHRIRWRKASQEHIELATPSIPGVYQLVLLDRDTDYIIDQTTINVTEAPKNSHFQLSHAVLQPKQTFQLSSIATDATASLLVSIQAEHVNLRQHATQHSWRQAASPLALDAPVLPGKYRVNIYDAYRQFMHVGQLSFTVTSNTSTALQFNQDTYLPNERMLATLQLPLSQEMQHARIEISNTTRNTLYTMHYLTPDNSTTRTLPIPAPSIVGDYQATLVTGTQSPQQAAFSVRAHDAQAQPYHLRIESHHTDNKLIQLHYVLPPLDRRHWIGLYRADNTLIRWRNIQSLSGDVFFQRPEGAGRYSIRLMANQTTQANATLELQASATEQEQTSSAQQSTFLPLQFDITAAELKNNQFFIGNMVYDKKIVNIQQPQISKTAVKWVNGQARYEIAIKSPEELGDYVFWAEQKNTPPAPLLNSIFPFKLTSTQALVYNPGMTRSSQFLNREKLAVFY